MYFYKNYAVVVDMADWKNYWDSEWERLNCREVFGHLSNENPPTEDEFPMYLEEGYGWSVYGIGYHKVTKEEFAAVYKKYREAEEAEFKAVDKLLEES